MTLTDDAKRLIQEEISSLTKEASETLLEIKEAKHELKAEVAERLSSHQKLLHELQIYAWVIRAAFVLLLGGTVYGILKVQDYVDGRIGLRVIKSDRMNLALSQANSGQWRDALIQLEDVYADIKSHQFTPSPEYRSFLFINLVWVISQIEEIQPDGTWVGETEWAELNKDDAFRREFLTSDAWEHDESFNDKMGFCTLKFNKTDNALYTAGIYFQRSLDASRPEIKKAPHLVALAIVDLIQQHQEAAIAKLKQAEALDPASYRIADWSRNYASFLNSTEFKIWDAVAKRFGVNFDKSFTALLKASE